MDRLTAISNFKLHYFPLCRVLNYRYKMSVLQYCNGTAILHGSRSAIYVSLQLSTLPEPYQYLAPYDTSMRMHICPGSSKLLWMITYCPCLDFIMFHVISFHDFTLCFFHIVTLIMVPVSHLQQMFWHYVKSMSYLKRK